MRDRDAVGGCGARMVGGVEDVDARHLRGVHADTAEQQHDDARTQPDAEQGDPAVVGARSVHEGRGELSEPRRHVAQGSAEGVTPRGARVRCGRHRCPPSCSTFSTCRDLRWISSPAGPLSHRGTNGRPTLVRAVALT